MCFVRMNVNRMYIAHVYVCRIYIVCVYACKPYVFCICVKINVCVLYACMKTLRMYEPAGFDMISTTSILLLLLIIIIIIIITSME